MPKDLIGCRKRRKLKALIPRVVVFVDDPLSVERRIDFAVFFIVLWSYSRKICPNMCHGKFMWLFISSQDLLYLRKVSVSQSWIPLQVVRTTSKNPAALYPAYCSDTPRCCVGKKPAASSMYFLFASLVSSRIRIEHANQLCWDVFFPRAWVS